VHPYKGKDRQMFAVDAFVGLVLVKAPEVVSLKFISWNSLTDPQKEWGWVDLVSLIAMAPEESMESMMSVLEAGGYERSFSVAVMDLHSPDLGVVEMSLGSLPFLRNPEPRQVFVAAGDGQEWGELLYKERVQHFQLALAGRVGARLQIGLIDKGYAACYWWENMAGWDFKERLTTWLYENDLKVVVRHCLVPVFDEGNELEVNSLHVLAVCNDDNTEVRLRTASEALMLWWQENGWHNIAPPEVIALGATVLVKSLEPEAAS